MSTRPLARICRAEATTHASYSKVIVRRWLNAEKKCNLLGEHLTWSLVFNIGMGPTIACICDSVTSESFERTPAQVHSTAFLIDGKEARARAMKGKCNLTVEFEQTYRGHNELEANLDKKRRKPL